MSYLSFSNSMNKANERCPLNCTPASTLLVRSASDSLQQCLKQAPFSPLPSSLTFLCARSPSLLPLWQTHTQTRKFPGALWLLRLSLTGWGLLCGRRRLGCAWIHCPKESCCCCTKHRQVQRIVINSPIFFSPLNFFLVTTLREA